MGKKAKNTNEVFTELANFIPGDELIVAVAEAN